MDPPAKMSLQVETQDFVSLHPPLVIASDCASWFHCQYLSGAKQSPRLLFVIASAFLPGFIANTSQERSNPKPLR